MRLSPPRPALGFAVRRPDLADRADVNFARTEPVTTDLVRRCRHQLVPLGSLVSRVQYGSSSRAVDEVVGTPMIRMVNLQDGDWDLSDLKYTTLSEQAQASYRLVKGDLCFTRTNGSKDLVGKCAVFREEGPWIYASYVIRVRVQRPADYLPEFLARFLNSDVGRVQIDRLSRQALMTNINAREIRDLLVPHPAHAIQQLMVDDLGGHWARCRRRMAEVQELLLRTDGEIAERLGLELAAEADPRAWAVPRFVLARAGRMNAEFFHPERLRVVRTILGASHPALALDDLAEFVRSMQPCMTPGDRYVGLANVERDTGELTFAAQDEEPPTGSVLAFRAGDVLFGKLRPYLNKVYVAEHDGVCSPEFFVLRPRPGIRAEYLATILRSQLTLAQTRHMAGGNTHPRLTPADVRTMLIPVPRDDRLQNEIADAEAGCRAAARALRAEAAADWGAAKQRFGDDLVA